ncbi:MAG: glycoside hydrolase family 88 protein [Paludibacter sp.]
MQNLSRKSVVFILLAITTINYSNLYAAINNEKLNVNSVKSICEKVADWQLANPSQLKEHGSTEWTQGALYTGIMSLYKTSENKKYLNAMLEMGQKNNWKPGPRSYFADDHTVCQTYIELYQITKNNDIINPTKKQFDSILTHPKTRNLEWPSIKSSTSEFEKSSEFENWSSRWAWCDALFMAPPVWAGLYAVTKDKRYLEFLDKEWWTTTAYLYDKEEGLFYRDSRFFNQRTPNNKKIFWGRGNGWVYAGITRVLNYLPSDYPGRSRYVQLYKEMTAAVVKTRQNDGLWRPSLLDSLQIPHGETSGSAFFCYGLAWGINQGILDSKIYWPMVEKSWLALTGNVLPDGKLGWVQPIGGAPDKVTAESTEVYGVGAFLLAGSEIYKYLKAHPDNSSTDGILTSDTMQKIRKVVIQDWLNSPSFTTNWLADSQNKFFDAYPSNKAFFNIDHIRSLMSEQREDGSWPDVDYKSTPRQNWPAVLHFSDHLHDLVVAYSLPGAPLYRDAKLKKKIIAAIDYWLNNDFQNPNWWYQSIGMPAYNLGPVLLCMRDELDAEQMEKCRKILSRCDLKDKRKWRTGGNLIFDCRAALYYGLMVDDNELVSRMFNSMIYEESKITPPIGSGIKEDFSEWEHGNLLFNHGYGSLLIGEASRLLYYANEVGIKVKPQAVDFISNFLLDGCVWMARGQFLDYSAMGRSIVTPKENVKSVMLTASPREEFNYMTLGAHYLQTLGTSRSNELAAVSQRFLGKAPALVGNKMFYMSDFMTHSRTNYYSSVRMSSNRTLNTEVCNGQNRLGHHLGEGTNYIIVRGNEYENIFPVWDWTKVPGTTVNSSSLDNSTLDELVDSGWFPSINPEEEGFGRNKLRVSRLGRTTFVGGVSDGLSGIACMELKVLTLNAKKSWFFMGNKIICLGSGITDKNSGEVNTTLNQCLLNGSVKVVDEYGTEKKMNTGIHHLSGAKMIYHDSIAYLFPFSQKINCSNQTQEGNWNKIDVNQSNSIVKADVFSLSINHGNHPENSSYGYIIIPGIDYHQAYQNMQNGGVSILSNTELLQAVEDKITGTLGVIFYKAGMLEVQSGHKIMVSQPCVLMISEKTKQIAVASPDGVTKTININLDGQMLFVNVTNGKSTIVNIL